MSTNGGKDGRTYYYCPLRLTQRDNERGWSGWMLTNQSWHRSRGKVLHGPEGWMCWWKGDNSQKTSRRNPVWGMYQSFLCWMWICEVLKGDTFLESYERAFLAGGVQSELKNVLLMVMWDKYCSKGNRVIVKTTPNEKMEESPGHGSCVISPVQMVEIK